jgi:hypothetical protein
MIPALFSETFADVIAGRRRPAAAAGQVQGRGCGDPFATVAVPSGV